MQKTVFFLLLLTAISLGKGIPAFPAEELFDTKAAAAHIEKGIESLKKSGYDAAITEFEAASEIQPDADVFYYLGYAYYMKGKDGDGESRKKAIENFEKAYEINPNFTPSKFKPEEAGVLKPGTESLPAETVETSETRTGPAPEPAQEQLPAQ